MKKILYKYMANGEPGFKWAASKQRAMWLIRSEKLKQFGKCVITDIRAVRVKIIQGENIN